MILASQLPALPALLRSQLDPEDKGILGEAVEHAVDRALFGVPVQSEAMVTTLLMAGWTIVA